MNIVPVSVIIVSYNTKDLTRKAILALRESSAHPKEVIVVDNNSEDGSVGMIRREFPEVNLIESKENLGFAKANNLAMEKTKEPYIWLLNSDTEIGKNTLKELYEYMERNDGIGALTPQLVYPDGKLQSFGGFFPSCFNVFLYLMPILYFLPADMKRMLRTLAVYPQPIPREGIELDYATGAALFLRRKALDQAGLLGEEYFMYFEETDLCWRLKKAGWKIKAINTDPVMHVYGGSFKARHDARRLRLFLKSLEKFVKKNYKGIGKYIVLLEIKLFGNISIKVKSLKNYKLKITNSK